MSGQWPEDPAEWLRKRRASQARRERRPLPKEDWDALYRLEEFAGTVNAEESLPGTSRRRNRELAVFSGEVYRVLHWINAPDCRENHPSFDPGLPVEKEGDETASP